MFERGFYASYRGNIEPLPVPFPRMFTKGRLNEMGMMKEQEQVMPGKEPAEVKDEFLLSLPSLTKLTQDGAYLSRMQSSYEAVRRMKKTTRV